MNIKGVFSSKSNEWETPTDLFQELDEKYHFTLDPSSTDENHKCDNYFTIKEDGLKQCWGGAYSVLQSAVWKRDWKMGRKSKQGKMQDCNAFTCKNRHKMVSRFHLWTSRDYLFERQTQIQRLQKFRTVSKYACNLQQRLIRRAE